MNDAKLAEFFQATGYLRVPEALPDTLVQDVRTKLEDQFVRAIPPFRTNRAGEVSRLEGLLDRDPIFLSVLRDPVVLDRLHMLLGPNIEVCRFRHNHATLNRAGDIPFRLHRDIQQWSRSLVSVFVYLEEATSLNGCTHIVPSSHTLPYAGPQSGDGGGNWADEHDQYRYLIGQELPMPMARGGVLMMSSLAFHTVGINQSAGTRMSMVFACHSSDQLDPVLEKSGTILVTGTRQFKGNPALRVSGSLINPEIK